MEENKQQKGKYIQIELQGQKYNILYDGFSFRVFVGDNVYCIGKYPSTLNGAIKIILREHHVPKNSDEVISIMEFVKQYESLLEEVRQIDFKTIEVDLKKHKMAQGTKKLLTQDADEETEFG